MRILFLTILILLSGQHAVNAQKSGKDTNEDVIFGGGHFIYKGKKIELGPKAFFIDGRLSVSEAAKYKYVYNSVNEASKHLTQGAEESPMVLYIVPWVYWIDDPDDPAIRLPKETGGAPVGLEINCEWLRFQGLSENPQDVVLACNRGQTMGAKGNFTMLRINGDGTSAENITFGNYCNIDLVYPRNPKLNRKKRGSAVVQAQLIFSNGDKVVARNTHFISRLNLGPFWGSKRTLFDRCHFECTDDALNGSAVYLNCTFDMYSSKPFAFTNGTGAVLLNCDIQSFTRGEQYFVKVRGPVTVVDTRFSAKSLTNVGWRDKLDAEARYYQYNVSLNSRPLFISKDDAYATIDMTGKEILNAYRVEYKNQIIYNTYNLLRGDDDWDPMGVKDIITQAGKENGWNFYSTPTQLIIKPTKQTLETGKDSLLLEATVNRFGNYKAAAEKINWSISPEYKSLVVLRPTEEGRCLVIPSNENNETKEVVITASTASGLEAASVLYIAPSFIEPPAFKKLPQISKHSDGTLQLTYDLDMTLEDQSLINWYRCSDAKGKHPIEVKVSRFNMPLNTYRLSTGDAGYFIMASVSPKHVRCNPGPAKTVVLQQAISTNDIKDQSNILIPDLKNMSARYQPEVIPGFWTLDSYAPEDTHEYDWAADNSRDPWYYGKGVDGAASDSGFVQAVKGARMRYTPVGNSFGDMKISFTAIPAKTAGQGFSSARAQYMDVGIKMDNEKMNGYALRLIRTTKYSDAIDFILMRYENGKATPISEPVSASCYRPDCIISIEVKENKLRVHAENPHDYYTAPDRKEVVRVVDMEAEIVSNRYGGISFQHTGTVGSGATLIKDLKIEWH